MERCIVCFKSNEDIFSRISTQSSEWEECNIQRIIEKHLWWWYWKKSREDAMRWVCRQCWQEISSFHNFYLTVEKEHRQNLSMAVSSEIKADENDNKPDMTVKQEIGNNTELCITEDSMPLKRCQRGRQRKLSDIEEFNIVGVKSENDISQTIIGEEAKDPCLNTDSILKNDVDALDIAPEHLIDFSQFDDDRHDTASDNEDSFSEPLVKETKRKSKAQTKTKKVCRTKKLKTASSPGKSKTKKTEQKEKSISKVTKIVKDDAELFLEGQTHLDCSICNIPLADFRILRQHFRSDHNIRGYAMCCSKKFYKRCLLIDHINVHKNAEYFKCDICSKSFPLRRCLEGHMKIHTTRERTFNCKECGKSYFKQTTFERHILSHVPENEKNFPCDKCGKKFASEALLRQHERTHSITYSKVCDICGKSFRCKYSFARHMDEHAGIVATGETCNLCGVILTSKYALNQHIKMRHTEENMKEQICPYCSKVSPNINAHRHHIQYAHTMERKHACHLCEKSFKRPLELKEHLSVHTGEALYTCPHCPRTFISNANMHKHRKIAHRKEWEEGKLKKFYEVRKKKVPNNNILDSVNKSVGAAESTPDNLLI